MRRLLAAVLVASTTSHAADEPFGSDKALHFSASVAISGAAYAGAALLLKEPVEGRLATAVGLGLFAGIAKELLDTQTGGTFSALDLAWDVAGTVVGTLLSWLIDRLFFARDARPLTPALSPPGRGSFSGESPAR